jgi:hypothetical protein
MPFDIPAGVVAKMGQQRIDALRGFRLVVHIARFPIFHFDGVEMPDIEVVKLRAMVGNAKADGQIIASEDEREHCGHGQNRNPQNAFDGEALHRVNLTQSRTSHPPREDFPIGKDKWNVCKSGIMDVDFGRRGRTRPCDPQLRGLGFDCK